MVLYVFIFTEILRNQVLETASNSAHFERDNYKERTKTN